MEPMFVTEAARESSRRLGREVTPRTITRLLYDRRVPEALAPLRNGRRLITEQGLEVIVAALREQTARRRRVNGGGDAT